MREYIIKDKIYDKTILVDLDNTLMDSLALLEDKYSWYDINKQDFYSFSRVWGDDKAKEIIKNFTNKDFLSSSKYILSTVNYLQNKKDYNILILSRTESSLLELRLNRLLKELPADISKRIIGMVTWESDYSKALNHCVKYGAVELVDDNPDNIIKANKKGIITTKVIYPYNVAIHSHNVILYKNKSYTLKPHIHKKLTEYIVYNNLDYSKDNIYSFFL